MMNDDDRCSVRCATMCHGLPFNNAMTNCSNSPLREILSKMTTKPVIAFDNYAYVLGNCIRTAKTRDVRFAIHLNHTRINMQRKFRFRLHNWQRNAHHIINRPSVSNIHYFQCTNLTFVIYQSRP